MARQHHPFTNPLTGVLECLYAGCGKEIPSDHYLCKTHYFRLGEKLIEPCPGMGCKRFKSISYDCCADCSRHLEPERDPAWDAGDAGCSEFFAYLLVSPEGDWYPGHTRSLRARVWMHSVGRCRGTADGDYRLVWFETFPTRAEAAAREVDLKRMVVADPYAVTELVFAFHDRIALVRPLLPAQ